MNKNNYKYGSSVIYLDKPVESYKTKEEMLDTIYALAMVERIDGENVHIEITDLDKYGYLVKDYMDTTVDHLLPAYIFERFVDAVDRYWNEKEKEEK